MDKFWGEPPAQSPSCNIAILIYSGSFLVWSINISGHWAGHHAGSYVQLSGYNAVIYTA